MTIEIRTIELDEIAAYAQAAQVGFLDPGPVPEHRIGRFTARFQPGRFWTADDDGRLVATLRSHTFDTTLPGVTLSTAGLTLVTVTATHRRLGLMSKMLRADMESSVERGEPLATLIAAEWPIYGRFGFAPAVDHAAYEIDAAAARWRTPEEGRVEVVDIETLRAEAPAVFDVHRVRSPGEISRDDLSWDATANITPLESPWTGFQVLCRDDAGKAVGYAIYSVDKVFDARRPKATVKLVEMIATTPAFTTKLWSYLTELDWVTTVVAEDRSVDDPLRYSLVDGRVARQTMRADFAWARPLDVVACLTARAYTGSGRIVFDVVDPMGHCTGRYALDATPEGAQCTRTDASADLTLPVGTVGALMFGGASLAQLAAAGLADEHRADAIARADSLFHWPVKPWSATWF